MAAANGIQPRGNMANSSFLQANNSNQIYSSNPPCLPTFNRTQKFPKRPLSVSFNLSNNSAIVSSPTDDVLKGSDESHIKDSVSSEKIDSWIQESVTDIVKNLKKAPLLVQIHAENNGVGGEKRRLKCKIEKAVLENWDFLKSEWENEGSKIPDAVVFVEELEEDQENSNQESGEGVNRVWGMVVQGKGVDCVPRCYLLKTNRICGGLGLGFCTHFCLMKVMDFRDTALGQFKHCWLLQ